MLKILKVLKVGVHFCVKVGVHFVKKFLWLEIKCMSLKASRSLQYFLKILEIESNLKGSI